MPLWEQLDAVGTVSKPCHVWMVHQWPHRLISELMDSRTLDARRQHSRQLMVLPTAFELRASLDYINVDAEEVLQFFKGTGL